MTFEWTCPNCYGENKENVPHAFTTVRCNDCTGEFILADLLRQSYAKETS